MPYQKLHAIISGHVQGVGYRFYTTRVAEMTGVSGWVRNLPDGSVEVTAVGDDDQIRLFLSALEKGPAYSQVERIDKEITGVQDNEFNSFEVEY